MRRRWAVFFLGGAVAGYLVSAAVLFLDQPRRVYHPERAWSSTPEDSGLAYEDVTFRAADGAVLSGWYVAAPESRGTVLFCHGNAGNISSEISVIRMFRELGFSSFTFDYRGFGKSEGTPSEPGTYEDAAAAWTYLTEEKGVPPSEIILWGRSLGAAIAVELATHHRAGALVLEAAFTSIPDLAAELYPLYPTRLLALFHYSTIRYVREVRYPVLVVHSSEDKLVPIRHGFEIYEAANEPKRFLEIKGPHKGLPYQEVYRRGIEKFLEDYKGLAA